MAKLPSATLRRAHLPSSPQQFTQCRHASLLRRPHRPYTFTQLVTLSDGSTYTQRTTSPQPIYRSTKDTRNHPLWQPSLDNLRNVEQDEAGRLRAFRNRFGRGWDLESTGEDAGSKEGKNAAAGSGADASKKTAAVGAGSDEEGSLMDLISGGAYTQSYQQTREASKGPKGGEGQGAKASAKDPAEDDSEKAKKKKK